jgi:hypothetical protein
MGISIFDKPLIFAKDTLFLAKKAARMTAYLVLKNNPQYAVPVALALGPIYDAIAKGTAAAAVKALIDSGLARLAQEVEDPLVQAEIADLGSLIEFEPTGDNDQDLGKLKEVLDAFRNGMDLAVKK